MRVPRGTTSRRISIAALLLFCGAASLRAQPRSTTEPAADAKVGKELRALRLPGSPPRIDGHLDDEVWTLAPAIDDLVQNEPDSMVAPTERTKIQVAFDDKYLYVAVRCFMHDPSQIASALGRRDTFPPSDLIRLSFDPRHDHSTAYVFHANPAGVQMDDTWFDDTRYSPDYDAIWEVRTAITSESWDAEFRIPFSQMRFNITPGEAAVWGFNVRRDIYRKGEIDRWVPTPRGVQGFVSRFGHLTFDDRLAPPRRVEVLPYATARREAGVGAANDHMFAGGVDARVGIGTANTLSASFNPDFGQVEQDPAVLNLTVFETFFPEKRPFFLEDSRIFTLPFPQFPLFHSRRIGQRPGRYELADTDRVIHRPEQTTILGAAKLTGKSAGWTFGALTALTAAEYATVDTTTLELDGTVVTRRTERLIEPRTSYNVARVQRDLFGSTSSIGGIVTGVLRDNDTDAFTGGVDYNFRWNGNKYQWDGHWTGTHAPVSGVVRNGLGGATRFSYSGKHLNVFGFLDHFSPYFRNADLGFLSSRPNKTTISSSVAVGQPDPRRGFRSLWGFADYSYQFNGDLRLSQSFVTGMDLQLKNFSFIGWNVGREFQAMDDLDTRGGPPIVTPAVRFLNVFVNSDSRKTWRVGGNAGISRDTAGGSNNRTGVFVNVQPYAQLQASVGFNYTFGETAAQWIQNLDADGDGEVDYVYGTLRRNVVDLTGRVTYAFTRNLTLQMFLQPFVAVGAYSDIRRLARPRSFDFTPVTLADNPDFNTKSLRSNTVLRWEYKPGSTLFLVWNRSAVDSARPGLFSAWHDLGAAFGADGSHVLMIKMSYWLGL